MWLIALVALCAPLYGDIDPPDIGMTLYESGEKAATPDERKKAFNAALFYYLHQPEAAHSGALFYNIGNCYYQLGEFGSATLYYYRALQLLPREEKIYTNLAVTAKKVGFESIEPPKGLFFYCNLSLFERSLALVACLLVAFVFFSFDLWYPHRVFQRLSRLAVGGVLLFTITLFWSSFFAPIEAVVIHPTPLFQGPGVNYARISKSPLPPGMKVRVIEVQQNGGWMSVELPTGERGYVSGQQAQAI